MIPLIVVLFFGSVAGGTGPAWHEWRARRERERLEAEARLPASARVVYLPSACCRPPA